MEDKTFVCIGCKRTFREKEFTPELVDLQMCPKCYTEKMTADLKQLKMTEQFTVVTLSREDLMDAGLAQEEVDRLTDEDMEELAIEILDNVLCKDCVMEDIAAVAREILNRG
jgi:predicted metal-binding protein